MQLLEHVFHEGPLHFLIGVEGWIGLVVSRVFDDWINS